MAGKETGFEQPETQGSQALPLKSGVARRRRAQAQRATAGHITWLIAQLQARGSHHSAMPMQKHDQDYLCEAADVIKTLAAIVQQANKVLTLLRSESATAKQHSAPDAVPSGNSENKENSPGAVEENEDAGEEEKQEEQADPEDLDQGADEDAAEKKEQEEQTDPEDFADAERAARESDSDDAEASEEELEELPTKEKEGDVRLGAAVRRTIDGTAYNGVLQTVQRRQNTNERLYYVQYDDGDYERITAHEADEAIMRAEIRASAVATARRA